jgi:hypothetical protein
MSHAASEPDRQPTTTARPTRVERALDLRESGDLRGAVAVLYEAAAEGGLDELEVVLTLAKMLAESNELEQAERWFGRACALAPEDLAVQLAHGTFLGQTGRLEASRARLADVGKAAREQLEAAMSDGQQELLGQILSFLGATEVNLARACLEAGDHAAAAELVRPWLADPEHWPWAHGVFEDLAEAEGLDPLAEARRGLLEGYVAPPMVVALVAASLAEDVPDIVGIDGILGRADAIFAFDWRHADPAFSETLGEARRAYGRAVMRGALPPGSCRHLDGPTRRLSAPDLSAEAGTTRHVHAGWRCELDGLVAELLGDLDGAPEASSERLADWAVCVALGAFRGWWEGLARRLASGQDVAAARAPYFLAQPRESLELLASPAYSPDRIRFLTSLSDADAAALLGPWLEPAVQRFVSSCREEGRATIADGLRELARLPQGEYVLATLGPDGPRFLASYPDHGRVDHLLEALPDWDVEPGGSLLVWRASGAAISDEELAWFEAVARDEILDAVVEDPIGLAPSVAVTRHDPHAIRVTLRFGPP